MIWLAYGARWGDTGALCRLCMGRCRIAAVPKRCRIAAVPGRRPTVGGAWCSSVPARPSGRYSNGGPAAGKATRRQSGKVAKWQSRQGQSPVLLPRPLLSLSTCQHANMPTCQDVNMPATAASPCPHLATRRQVTTVEHRSYCHRVTCCGDGPRNTCPTTSVLQRFTAAPHRQQVTLHATCSPRRVARLQHARLQSHTVQEVSTASTPQGKRRQAGSNKTDRSRAHRSCAHESHPSRSRA